MDSAAVTYAADGTQQSLFYVDRYANGNAAADGDGLVGELEQRDDPELRYERQPHEHVDLQTTRTFSHR